MEREVYNEETGQWELVYDGGMYWDQTPAPTPAPDPFVAGIGGGPAPTTTPPPTNGRPRNPNAGPPGSQTPNMDPPGFRGGYWGDDGQWVQGSPYQQRDETQVDPRVSFGGAPQMRSLNDLWPQWSPPQWGNLPTMTAPEPFSYADFSYEDFAAPTLQDAENEPGYAFAATQGRKQVEASKAAQGVYKSGQTLKDIYAWASEYAKQNYGGAFDRKLQTYGTNRGNAFGNWQANRGNAADNYMMNYGVSRDVFDRNYGSSRDLFDRNYNSYQSGFDSQKRKAELEFARDWDQYASDIDIKKTLYSGGND